MQLIELKTFLAIIETGSLVKASHQLNVTQSTVTARLKSLEEELGQTLVNRQKSGATMTAAGERLRRYAGTISDLWRQAHQEISLPDALSAVCNLGCQPDLWPNLGKKIFDHVKNVQNNAAISVWHGSDTELAKWLDDGLIDVSLTYWSNARQAQTVTPLTTERLILVSTQKDRPTKFDPGYIFIEAGEEFGRDHAAAYADADTARINFSSAALGIEHLLNEDGSAYLPERIVQPYLQEGKLHRLENAPVFERNVFLVMNKSAENSWPTVDEMIGIVE